MVYSKLAESYFGTLSSPNSLREEIEPGKGEQEVFWKKRDFSGTRMLPRAVAVAAGLVSETLCAI